jgi:hypothetical protein
MTRGSTSRRLQQAPNSQQCPIKENDTIALPSSDPGVLDQGSLWSNPSNKVARIKASVVRQDGSNTSTSQQNGSLACRCRRTAKVRPRHHSPNPNAICQGKALPRINDRRSLPYRTSNVTARNCPTIDVGHTGISVEDEGGRRRR